MNKKKRTTSKKKSAPKISDLEGEQRRRAQLKQKHCDAVALHIISKLIDCPVEEDVFLQSLRYLNEYHYQDIAEERAITKLCGYPVCGNEIPELPDQRYHISSKSNKVYDVTDRKNYCSNFCYSAGNFIKSQMLTSPLWYRDQEKIPKFHLLPKSEKSSPGKEVDQGIVKVPKEGDPGFTSISQFTQDILNDMPDNYGEENDDDSHTESEEECITHSEVPEINEEYAKIRSEPRPSTSKVSLKQESPKQATVSQELPKIENLSISTQENFFYSKMFAPSLADILTENAKYFEGMEKQMTEKKEEESKSEKPNVKGILSKKGEQKIKKTVSFSSDNKNQEQRIFKKPVVSQMADLKKKSMIKSENTSKDTERGDNSDTQNPTENSLLNKPVIEHEMDAHPHKKFLETVARKLEKLEQVDEKKDETILSIKNSATYASVKNLSNNEVLINEGNGEDQVVNDNANHQKPVSEDSLINKSVTEHKPVISETKLLENVDDKREKRKLNLRNSATYAKAKNMSKKDVSIQNETDVQTRTEVNTNDQKTEDSLINKPLLELKPNVPETKSLENIDVTREKRRVNFKNSATYAKAKNMSVNNTCIQNETNLNHQKLEDSLNNKPITQHNLDIIPETPSEGVDKREKRKFNIKNSATYAKAKNVSKQNGSLQNKIENEVRKTNEVNKNHQKLVTEDSLIKKPIIEHKSVLIEKTSNSLQKQDDKLNIKNSSATNKNVSAENILTPTDQNRAHFKSRLMNCLQEWCTLETMIFLYGEKEVQEIVTEKEFKQYLNNKKNSEEEEVKRKQYKAICRRLNLMELADKKFDDSVREMEKKPLPDYSQLREEAETMDLRVRAFYSGCFEVYETEDQEEEEESECIVKGTPAVLPLVDCKDYQPLRRKIFLTSLSRTLPKLSEILRQPENLLMSDLKKLVDTFSFNANNIVFKTAEWYIVAILLVKTLAMKDNDYVEILDTERTRNHIKTLTKDFPFTEDDLNKSLKNVVDMHVFLKEYLKRTNDLL